MHLKSIELYGFKSFSNKTKFALKPDITCVVGPNGCGKSNVVDAIRWCIGEMSWKALRLPSMQDVIFTGTDRRQPMNFAEVSLTFDNESGKLPFNFKEITITRKIYRSGESEYFINKVQCRLKDIREMFLDTGIGASGYAIIDQGEVNRILNSNPQERRSLFEEAAGVSKYKAKREEALRKLEKVDMDLGRLADSMKLIDENIKKLDKEAKKARLQQKYREELKGGEIALLVRNSRDLENNIAKMNSELEPVNRELEELNLSITGIEGEIGALKIDLTRKREENRLLLEEISSLKTEKSSCEGKLLGNEGLIKEIERNMAELAALKENAEKELEKALPGYEEIKSAIEEYDNRFSGLKTELDSLLEREKELSGRIGELGRSLSETEAAINSCYSAQREVNSEIARTESDIAHFKETKLYSSKEAELLRKRKGDAEAALSGARSRLEKAKTEFAGISASLAELEGKKKEEEAALSSIREKIMDLSRRKAGAESRLDALVSQGEKDPYWVGINAVLNSGIDGVRGTLRHLLDFDSEYSLAAEEAFGQFMDAVVCDTAETAEEAAHYLESIGKGRARFLILDRVEEVAYSETALPNSFKLLSKIKCPPEYEKLVKALAADTFVSGDKVIGPYWITGGVGKIVPPDAYWREEEELKNEIKKITSELDAANLESGKKASLVSEMEESILRCRETHRQKEIELNRISVEIDGASRTLDSAVSEINALESELEKNDSSLRSREEFLEELKAKAVSLRKEEEKLRGEFDKASSARKALEEDLSEIKEKIAAKKAVLENEEKNLSGIKKRGEEARARIENLKEQAGRFEKRKEESLERIAGLRAEIASLKESLENTRNDLTDKELLEVQMRKELDELQLEFDQKSARVREIRDAAQERESRKHEIEIQISADKTKLDEIKSRVQEWNMTYEEALDAYSDAEVDEERIEFLRKRIENMGPINMTAPQEYDALINRYNFLNSQVEDLNKAKSDLKSAINKINEITRKNFKETFEKIKTHFENIYGILFNGGEANLVLTEPENLLETGVEIVARPPGKKVVSISQLSGGEEALTALALLFSFFTVNPSPFCVMDEADSALDEANTRRFANLIKEYEKTTQFLIITHNKRMMEIASHIYGVTMEEPGVSRMLSVDLKKAADLAEEKKAVSAG